MSGLPEGRAVVYCEGAFGTTNGKTAHGLVRRTRRYEVLSVVDSRHAGRDAGEVLDGGPSGTPVVATLEEAIERARAAGTPATHFVVGLAPDGGRLEARDREVASRALAAGLDVDCGLHDFLSEDPDLVAIAERTGARIRDVRKPPPRSELHFFSGKIDDVDGLKIAVLGTDSAVGKRTTAWLLVEALEAAGLSAEMIGTGQTAWMQGVRYGMIMDSLISDFVSGEIEHAVWLAWTEARPDVLVLEGQGSLMNPAYPGGMELIAAGRPDVLVLQHAPTRKHYDGFPRYPMDPLDVQIRALEAVSKRPVVAVTLNHEGIPDDDVRSTCEAIAREHGRPCVDVLRFGATGLVDAVRPHVRRLPPGRS